jgi:transposase-like protein
MRTREKLTLEEKFALALELIKRERTLEEIRRHYRVSHTTAYKIRKTFLDGGRAALEAERHRRPRIDLEARVAALEDRLDGARQPYGGNGRLAVQAGVTGARALDRSIEK